MIYKTYYGGSCCGGMGQLECFTVENSNDIILICTEMGCSYKVINSSNFVPIGFEFDLDLDYRPATRKELIKSGLWDFVQNKDSTSCKEDELEKLSDELESYLELADADKSNGLKD